MAALKKLTSVLQPPREDRRLRDVEQRIEQLTSERPALLASAEELRDRYAQELIELGPKPAIERLGALDPILEQGHRARQAVAALDAEVERLTKDRDVMRVAVTREQIATDAGDYRKAVQAFWDAIQTAGVAAERARALASRIETKLGDVNPHAVLGFPSDALRLCDEFRGMTDFGAGGPWKAWRDEAAAFGLIDAPAPRSASSSPSTPELMRRARADSNAAAALSKWTPADDARIERDPQTGRVILRGE